MVIYYNKTNYTILFLILNNFNKIFKFKNNNIGNNYINKNNIIKIIKIIIIFNYIYNY